MATLWLDHRKGSTNGDDIDFYERTKGYVAKWVRLQCRDHRSLGTVQFDKTSGQGPLVASKLARDEAEYARQNIANEILEAAKTVCGELIADTERTLEKARYLETEADRKHVEAHEERERAADIRQEAEEYRESLIEDAKRQSAEHIERARSASERECSEMKQRASIEAEKMMAYAQVMRAAALEELEAQKIYAEAARFKAASRETLNQARNRLDDARTSALLRPGVQKQPHVPTPAAEPVKNNINDPGTDPAGRQGQVDRATAIALGTIDIEPPRRAPMAITMPWTLWWNSASCRKPPPKRLTRPWAKRENPPNLGEQPSIKDHH